MKARESGMPDETTWDGYFEPERVLRRLGLTEMCRDVIDFGCGYGTFSLPAARIVRGAVHALDIEPAMVEATAAKARSAGLANVHVEQRDFISLGSGLPDASMDYAMLFNLLHCEEPLVLLREASRVLATWGRLGIMHWNHDPATPRGPSMDIRPCPEQCRVWAETVGFYPTTEGPIDLPPYHYGWVMRRCGTSTAVGE
ncbi:MAG: class I SAM-dependent methyltransferase [bacterium]